MILILQLTYYFLPLLVGKRKYFAEGADQKPYSASSIREFLYKSSRLAGISKTLQHSKKNSVFKSNKPSFKNEINEIKIFTFTIINNLISWL
mgnify:CR=1 FL=1|jgi:hypothetical protein